MSNEPLDFKEQMAEARRTQILMGAAQVFAEKGFHKAKTKEIAKAAGVSEGTIYNYFDNKRELLLALIDLIAVQSFKDIMVDDPPEDPREFFTGIFHNRFQLLQERGHHMLPLFAEMFTDADLREALYQQIIIPMASYVERYVQTHIDSGCFRQIDPVIVPRTLIAAMFVNAGFKLSNLDPRYEDISPDSMIEQLISLFLDGLLINEQ